MFSGNHANWGGGIANLGTLKLINSTVSNNSAINRGATGGLSQGGGIFNAGTLEVVNSVVIGNTAADQGGGIFNAGALTIENSIVTDNTAKVGGGIYMCLEGQVWGFVNTCHGTLTLKNTSVTENTPDNIFPW